MIARGWSAPRARVQRVAAAAALDHPALRDHLMPRTVHIIGAGLAGLAAAVRLARARRDASSCTRRPAQAGGRCRSYHDRSHRHDHRQRQPSAAVGQSRRAGLSATRSARADRLVGPDAAEFPFVDLATSERWTLRINDGVVPWWIFDRERAACRARASSDYLALARLLLADAASRCGEVDRLRGPALRAAGAAAAAGGAQHRAAARARPRSRRAWCARRLLRGGQACRPLIARDGLGHALIEPALELSASSATCAVRLRHAAARARASRTARVAALDFGDDDDRARRTATRSSSRCRPGRGARWCPALTAPTEFRAIVNAHFRIDAAARTCRRSSAWSTARWNGCSPSRAGSSVTISAADRLLDTPREALARTIWREVAAVDRHCRRSCRRGRSCASGARPSPPRRSRTRNGPAPRRAWRNLVPGRRLDRYGLARHHRRCHSLRAAAPPIWSLQPSMMPMNHRHRADDRPTSRSRAGATASRAATDALLDAPAAGRPLGVRARSRRHHPGRIRAAAALSSASRSTPSSSARSRVYLRRIQGAHGGWPLFHDGAFDMSASVKAYFALKMIGDDIDAPTHARARARRSCARGGAAQSQRVHPRAARALRRDPLARGAGDAGRDHAAAELVSVPSRQDLVLGRTVIVPLLVLLALEAAGEQSARRHASTNCSSRTRSTRRRAAQGAAPEMVAGSSFFRALDIVLRALEPLLPKRLRKRAIDRRGRLRHRAAQRRGRPRRDLPGDGQQRDDVRRARLSAGPSAPRRSRARSVEKLLVVKDDEAYCQPCVSPVWDTGARLPRAARSRRRAGAVAQVEQRARLAQAAADARRQGRLGRQRGRTCGRAAGRSSTPTRTIPISTTPRWWRWRWTARRRCERGTDLSTRRSTRAREWIVGLQSKNGGWGAFDADNDLPLSQQHPVRRSRRAARSADRGRHRALRLDAGAARRDAPRTIRADARARSTICARRSTRREAGTAAGA